MTFSRVRLVSGSCDGSRIWFALSQLLRRPPHSRGSGRRGFLVPLSGLSGVNDVLPLDSTVDSTVDSLRSHDECRPCATSGSAQFSIAKLKLYTTNVRLPFRGARPGLERLQVFWKTPDVGKPMPPSTEERGSSVGTESPHPILTRD